MALPLTSAMPTNDTRSEPTLSTGAGARMTAEQAALLKTLAHEAYDFEAFGPNLTQDEAARRIATLKAKLALQGEPPHTA